MPGNAPKYMRYLREDLQRHEDHAYITAAPPRSREGQLVRDGTHEALRYVHWDRLQKLVDEGFVELSENEDGTFDYTILAERESDLPEIS